MIASDRTKLFLLCIGTACSFALAALTSEMFGDGSLPSYMMAYRWTCFSLGLTGSIVAVMRAFFHISDPLADAKPTPVEIKNTPEKPVAVHETAPTLTPAPKTDTPAP